MESKVIENGRLGYYLKIYNELKSKVDNSIAIVIMQEIGKDDRCNSLRSQEQKRNVRADLKATPKQLEYMENLGIEFDGDISMAEASALIDEAKKKNRK